MWANIINQTVLSLSLSLSLMKNGMVRNTFWQSFTYPSGSSFRKLGVIRRDSSKAMFKGAPRGVITTSPHCGWVRFIAKSPMNVYDTICMTFILISAGIKSLLQ